ncbi:SixA phosphatase family protein [Mucilaginibacter celer]|uniref:Histidine phosphatase family protein n=1 Tax=Mucilaginibacter celer TaxID=2305508 RepID=A0A494VKZ4_9SPHI|nr:histidine phosphatase family protein [Mucilaginibacter celer]AYL94709.1 histidine phosphatase family protein [Mucilaginibacter celer]
MKKLMLIRHAKATHESGYADFDRPLKPSGMQDAALMATLLRGQMQIPEIVVTSPALRTLNTAEIFANQFKIPAPLTDKRIYEASENTWVKVVNDLPVDHNFVAVVGHNPGISHILYYLTGQVKDMPTGAVAIITFENDDWQSISEEDGKLVHFDSPKG